MHTSDLYLLSLPPAFDSSRYLINLLQYRDHDMFRSWKCDLHPFCPTLNFQGRESRPPHTAS